MVTSGSFNAFVHSITFDDGKEFTAHEAIAKARDADSILPILVHHGAFPGLRRKCGLS